MSCEEWKPLLSGYVDSELTPAEEESLKGHLSHCSDCRDDLMELRNIEGVTEVMKNETLPDAFWDTYWLSVYNRLERGLGWILLSVGAALLLGFGAFHFVTDFLLKDEAPLIVRVGTALGMLGLALLTISLIRERIRSWRHDPYKEVKR